jgi:putative flippase GtrA
VVEAGNVSRGKRLLFTHVARFTLVGACCAAIDSGCYAVLLQSGVWTHGAKAVSFLLGTVAAFFLNRRFVFGATGSAIRQVSGFAVLYGTTFAVNVGINAGVLAVLPAGPWEYAAAWLVAQGFATAVNFAVLRAVVFRERRKPGGGGHAVVG